MDKNIRNLFFSLGFGLAAYLFVEIITTEEKIQRNDLEIELNNEQLKQLVKFRETLHQIAINQDKKDQLNYSLQNTVKQLKAQINKLKNESK